MNRFFAFLALVILVSACTATTQLPPQTNPLSNTPTPAPTLIATDNTEQQPYSVQCKSNHHSTPASRHQDERTLPGLSSQPVASF
jgi:hypothetical protein